MKNKFLRNFIIFFLFLKVNINIELNDLEDEDSLISIAKMTTKNLQEFPFKKELGFNYSNYYLKNLSNVSNDDFTKIIIENIQPLMFISNDSDIILINEEDKSFSYKEILINVKFDLKLIYYSKTANSDIELNKFNLFTKNRISNLIFKKIKNSEKFELYNYYQDYQLISQIDILDNNLFFSKKVEILAFIENSIIDSTLNYIKNIIFYYPQNEQQRRLLYLCQYLSNNITYSNHMSTGLNKILFRKTDYLMGLDGTILNIRFNVDFTVTQLYYANEYIYASNVSFVLGFNCQKFETSFGNNVVDISTFYNGIAQIVGDIYYRDIEI
jgi:hypothetical protein